MGQAGGVRVEGKEGGKEPEEEEEEEGVVKSFLILFMRLWHHSV